MADFNFGNGNQEKLNNLARAELFRRAKGLAYTGIAEGKEAIDATIRAIQKDDKHPELIYRDDYSARLLVPYIISLRFNETSYFDANGDEETTDGFAIELATCSVTKSKNTVITPILNEDGSIIQITGSNNYKVNINVFLIGNSNKPQYEGQDGWDTEYAKPKSEIETLIKILETNTSLEVSSTFLEYFGISNLVIQSYSMPQDFTTKNIQEFQIVAISDDPKIKLI